LKTFVKDIANVQTGLFAKPSERGNVVYLQAKHFDENGQLLGELYPDLCAEDISEKHLLKAGDLLFSAKGTKNFAAVYGHSKPAAVASTSFFVLKIIDRNTLPEYFAWFLNHPDTQNIIKDQARGTAIPSIRKSVLENLEIFIPSIEHQKAVIALSALMRKESELRMAILQHRRKLIEHQIIHAIK
jgi:restriction endonuclease S subunit